MFSSAVLISVFWKMICLANKIFKSNDLFPATQNNTCDYVHFIYNAMFQVESECGHLGWWSTWRIIYSSLVSLTKCWRDLPTNVMMSKWWLGKYIPPTFLVISRHIPTFQVLKLQSFHVLFFMWKTDSYWYYLCKKISFWKSYSIKKKLSLFWEKNMNFFIFFRKHILHI